MPQGYAYLEGGPCDKKTVKLTPAESDSGELVCKDGLYKNPEQGELHDGSVVFKYAGKYSQGVGVQRVPDSLRAWRDMRHAYNHKLPRDLHEADKLRRRTLQELARVRKVGR
jgi:hypothetical protein